MEDYIKCEQIGGKSPRYINTFSNLFIVAVHYTHHYMLCVVAIGGCTHEQLELQLPLRTW